MVAPLLQPGGLSRSSAASSQGQLPARNMRNFKLYSTKRASGFHSDPAVIAGSSGSTGGGPVHHECARTPSMSPFAAQQGRARAPGRKIETMRREVLLLGGAAAAACTVQMWPPAAAAAQEEAGVGTAASAAPLPTVPRVPLSPAAPGLEISRVIKGCWQLSGGHRGERNSDRTSGEAAVSDFGEFVDNGITTLDAADHYGAAEPLIGRFLADNPDARSRVQARPRCVLCLCVRHL